MNRVSNTNMTASTSQRASDYLCTSTNPYELSSTAVKVRISFAGECDVSEAVSHYLAARENARSAIQSNQ